LEYRNELNTYDWQWQLAKPLQISPAWQLSLSEQFRASMLKLSNAQQWKDEQNLVLSSRYRLDQTWQALAAIQSMSFRDKQTGLNSDIVTNGAQVGALFNPNAALRLQGQIGPKWDYRMAQKDFGWTYAVDAAARDVEWLTYHNDATVALSEDLFNERRNTNWNAAYQVHKSFAAATADTVRVYYNKRRNDNYTSVSGDIESLRESNKGVYNVLGYPLADRVRLALKSGWQFRNVEVASYADGLRQRSRKRNDQMSDNAMVVRYDAGKSYAVWQLQYQTQTQKYDLDVSDLRVPFSRRTAFITPNNASARLAMNGEWAWRMSRRDSLYTWAAISRFKYDTPDTSNFDDRDELRGHVLVAYRHRFSRTLAFDLQASANWYHMVYIFAERSADNNWNRILRLRPGLDYRPHPRFRLYQSYEVLANYVDYDFESPGSVTRSNVFRKLAVDDSLRWHWASHSSLALDYRLQVEENGQLFWERWSERVLITRQSHWLQLRLQHSGYAGLRLAPGFCIYSRNEWRHDQTALGLEIKKKAGTFFSYGPMLRLHYQPNESVRVVIDGIRRRVRPEGQTSYVINTLDIDVELYF
jgi:hypothetical protein